MKNTGILRKVDDLGRIVIPKSIREQFGVVDGTTKLECYVDNNNNFVLKNPNNSFEQGIRDILADSTINESEKLARIKRKVEE